MFHQLLTPSITVSCRPFWWRCCRSPRFSFCLACSRDPHGRLPWRGSRSGSFSRLACGAFPSVSPLKVRWRAWPSLCGRSCGSCSPPSSCTTLPLSPDGSMPFAAGSRASAQRSPHRPRRHRLQLRRAARRCHGFRCAGGDHQLAVHPAGLRPDRCDRLFADVQYRAGGVRRHRRAHHHARRVTGLPDTVLARWLGGSSPSSIFCCPST